MRLIDADALIEKYENDFMQGLIESFDDVIGIVEEQSTAYDVDKVVEELKEEMHTSSDAHVEAIIGMCGVSANMYYGEKTAYSKAIDIVRKGGAE